MASQNLFKHNSKVHQHGQGGITNTFIGEHHEVGSQVVVKENKAGVLVISRLTLQITDMNNRGLLPHLSFTGITVKTLIIHGNVGKIPRIWVEDGSNDGWTSRLEELNVQDVDLDLTLLFIHQSLDHSAPSSPLSSLTTLTCPVYTVVKIPLPQLRKLTLLHGYHAPGDLHVWARTLGICKPLYLPRLTTLGFDFYPPWTKVLLLFNDPRPRGEFGLKELTFPALSHPRILKELVFALGGQRSPANSPPGDDDDEPYIEREPRTGCIVIEADGDAMK